MAYTKRYKATIKNNKKSQVGCFGKGKVIDFQSGAKNTIKDVRKELECIGYNSKNWNVKKIT